MVRKKRNKLLKQYFDQLAVFHHCLKSVGRSHEIEKIHELRVAIKKLRTLLTLMEEASERKFSKKKQFKLFRNLFRKAGEVREAQVNLELLTKESALLLPEYSKWLEDNVEKAKIILSHESANFNTTQLRKLTKRTEKNVIGLSNKTIKLSALRFVQEKLARVGLLVKLNASSELHEIRRLLNSAEEVLKVIYGKKRHQLRQQLKPFHKEIGHWHDVFILAVSLDQYLDQCPESTDSSNVLEFKELIIIKNASLEKDLMLSLSDFLVETTEN